MESDTIQRFKTCPCCGGDKFSEFKKKIEYSLCNKPISNWRDFYYGNHEFLGQLFQCESCGFHFIENPSERAVEFYMNAATEDYLALEHQRRNYFKKLRKFLLDKAPHAANTSVVADYGCGSGTWLTLWDEADRRIGIEVNPTFLDGFKSLNIEPSDGAFAISEADRCLFSAFDYLEHVESPVEFLEEMKRGMGRGNGIIVLGVPDMGKIAAQILGLRYYLYCPMHFNYFTKKSLTLLCQSVFAESKVSVFASPQMKTTLAGALKWIAPNANSGKLGEISLPIGYSASLIALIDTQSRV